MNKIFHLRPNVGGTMRALKSVWVLALVGCQFIFGEAPSPGPGPGAEPHARDFNSAPVRGRAEDKGHINNDVVNFISKNFLLSDEYIRTRWARDDKDTSDSLPDALREMGNDDQKISKVIAQLLGTLNKELSQSVYLNARNRLLDLKGKAGAKNSDTEIAFLERLLFGIHAWPAKPDPKMSFCLAPIDQMQGVRTGTGEEEKALDSSMLNNWDGFATAYRAHGKVTATKLESDAKPEQKTAQSKLDLANALNEKCYGEQDGKLTNPSYESFLKHFKNSAEEVWKHNVAFHQSKDKFNSSEPADKKAALQEVKKSWSDRDLAAFADQQRRSGYDKDGKEISSENLATAGTAYKMLAWRQHNDAPAVNLSLKTQVGTASKVVDVDWKKEESPADVAKKVTAGLAANDIFAKRPIKPEDYISSIGLNPEYKPVAKADVVADQANGIITPTADFAAASTGMVQGCTGCHGTASQNTDATDSFAVTDFSKMTREQIISAAGAVDRMVQKKGAKIDPVQVAALKDWAKKLEDEAKKTRSR